MSRLIYTVPSECSTCGTEQEVEVQLYDGYSDADIRQALQDVPQECSRCGDSDWKASFGKIGIRPNPNFLEATPMRHYFSVDWTGGVGLAGGATLPVVTVIAGPYLEPAAEHRRRQVYGAQFGYKFPRRKFVRVRDVATGKEFEARPDQLREVSDG